MTKHRLKTSPFWAIAVVAALGMGLAGCGSSGSDSAADDTPPPVETPDLTPAQNAAAMAASAAALAVMGQESNKDADLASYGAAQSAASRAQAAAAAAAAATTLAAAEAARDAAVDARDDAVMYAGMVRDEAAEDAAQMAAAQAAVDARTAAEAARTAADAVALIAGADSSKTADANAAAEAAETAANAAEEASENAQAADTLEDAVSYRDMAIAERNKAQGQQAMAEAGQKDAEEIADIRDEGLEAIALADAQEATKKAADSVAAHLTAAQNKAADARAQANAARAAANRARSARRDYANADKYATQAETEARAAEAALARAQQANTNAQAALTAAMVAETSGEAEAQQALAEAEDLVAAEAHTGDTGAGMAYMAAKDAAEKAVEASLVDTAGILVIANQDFITGTRTRATNRRNVQAAINLQASDTDNTPDSPNSAAGTTAVGITWPYADLGDDNTAGGTGDNADTPGGGVIDIHGTAGTDEIMLGGTSVPFTRDNPATAGTNERTFVEGVGLGDFAEYRLWQNPAAPALLPRTRAIVFTDKEQAAAPIPSSNVTFSGLAPIASRLSRNTADDGYEYDHDGNPLTTAVPVGLTCAAGVSCDVRRDAMNKVVSVTGYRLASNPDTDGDPQAFPVPGVPEADDATYLAFGVWLTETAGASAGDPNVYTFGAFGSGGTGMTSGTATAVVGTATYNGSAAGLHSRASGVNFFHGDATLNADFGEVDEVGSVHGRIHNIMSGGVSVGHDIYLDAVDDNDNTAGVQSITADGAFNGTARMGPGSTDSVTGITTYPMNGTWQGNFYNPARTTAPAGTAPMSAAGTFGVGRTDNARTPANEAASFVGAFGAHR